MKGLILKDFYNIGKSAKQLIIILAIICICIGSSGGAEGLSTVCAIISASMVITTFAMDERSGWPSFALTMPVSRRDYISAKYITAVLFCFVGIIMGTVIGAIVCMVKGNLQVDVLLESGVAGILIGLIFEAVIIPLMIKFGTENARFIVLGVVAVPSLGAWILGKNVDLEALTFTPQSETLMIIGLVVFAVIADIVSYFISVGIFSKKDF